MSGTLLLVLFGMLFLNPNQETKTTLKLLVNSLNEIFASTKVSLDQSDEVSSSKKCNLQVLRKSS